MKALICKPIAILAILAGILLFTACQKSENAEEDIFPTADDTMQPTTSAVESRSNPNSAVFPPTANMYGKSYAEWSIEWWKWILSYPCANNPLADQTGANAAQGQSGPVWFLAGNTGGTTTRNVTIPHGKAALFPIINYLNDHPCPDPNFGPAPGQSMEEFLQEGASAIIDLGEGLSVTLDGEAMNNIEDYRFLTSLFNFDANNDLVNCFDPCEAPGVQPYVSDGYWMMLKPLKKGQHTLNFQSSIPMYGFVLDVTFNITVP